MNNNFAKGYEKGLNYSNFIANNADLYGFEITPNTDKISPLNSEKTPDIQKGFLNKDQEDITPIEAFKEFNAKSFKGYDNNEQLPCFWQPPHETNINAEHNNREHDRHHQRDNHQREHHHERHHEREHNNRHDIRKPESASAPRMAPPSYIPKQAAQLRAIEPGAIEGCIYSYTYIWLQNGQHFWFYPTFIGRRSISGYRWMGSRWVYMGFDLRMIDSFFCGGK